MKPTVLLAIVLAPICRADEAADRAAIEKMMPAITRPNDRAALFAPGADVREALERIDRLVAEAPPWSERRPPAVHTQDIRFVTADVVLVDARASREGMMVIPFLCVLRRDAGQWRIVALRVTAAPRASVARTEPAGIYPLPPARPACRHASA